MRVVGSWISDSDQIDEGVCFLSNLHRWLRDEQTRTAPVGNDAGAIEESSGLRVGMTAHRSTVTRALRCIKHDGDRGKMERGSGGGGAHLLQQMARRAAVAARGGGAAPPGSGDDGGSLQWGSVSKRTMGSFTVGSSTFSQPPIVTSDGGLMRTKRNSWQLGFGLCKQNPGNTVTYI
jgi:hypothetical protein